MSNSLKVKKTKAPRASIFAGPCSVCDCNMFTCKVVPRVKCDCGHLKMNHQVDFKGEVEPAQRKVQSYPGLDGSNHRRKVRASQAIKTRRLVIYTVNDVYTTENMGKLSQFIIDSNKILKPTKHFTILPGDFLGPSTLSLFDQGANMVEVMNAVGFDYVCYGNHELDLCTLPVFCDRIGKLTAIKLNQNVRFTEPVPENLDVARDIVNIDGFKLGLTGLLLKETQDMLEIAKGKAPFHITDVEECYQAAIDALYLQEPSLNMVIALTHQFMPADRIMAKNAKGLHLIVGGHEHDQYDETYEGVPIMKVGENATHCGVIIIDINPDNSFKMSRQVHEIFSLKAENPKVREIIDKGQETLVKFSSYTLYEIKPDLPIWSENVRNVQTTLGALFCDIVKDYFRTQVCVISSGKLRAQKKYPNGITFLDVQSELPFGDNQTVFCKMTGAEIAEAVYYSRTAQKGQGGFLQTDSGIVTDSEHNVTHVFGEPVDATRSYTCAVPLSMLKGMDNNPTITGVGEKLKAKAMHPHDFILLQDAVTIELVHRKWGDMKKPSFQEIAPEGVCNRHEFKNAMKDLLPEAMADLFFDSLNADGSGVLSVDDFEDKFVNFRTISEQKSKVKRPVKTGKNSKVRRDTLSLWKQRGSIMPQGGQAKGKSLLTTNVKGASLSIPE
eukprot:gb/GEZN01001025.1/.p1 GENE.gb/GEZN01001025.1/~~gb/GEZN01001025.1/.p1  ORF type:complete len:686 (+),score=73.25 gb/GEZN01001025.1/:57-2060(+)